ncbi:MAG: hypothetical protein O9267_12685 [Flavobacterium sp.]|uniref:hypothetical protein n=1 Tax=Flavobacterium sp. TaxID=239 RepID=UPI0022BE407D|nr:hypothetical protein [Flavobacterium sp.]MCZ8198454.1 hypothetical protein [Flavobacterium sp.]
MKKIIGLFALLLLVNACDDGDIIIENIDLTDVQPKYCIETGILYKFSGNQALLAKFSETDFNRVFINKVSTNVKTIVINNTTNRFIYRNYSGTVADNSICGTILAANPQVTEEWVALNGTAEITTDFVLSTPTSDNATRVTAYRHSIIFKDVTFQKPDGSQIQYEEFLFGNYDTAVEALPLTFTEDKLTKSTCANDYSLYNVSGKGEMRLKLIQTDFENLIQNSPTAVDSPRKITLNSSNTLTYNLYESAVTNIDFCTATLPTISEIWKAKNGEIGVSGIVEVVTISAGGGTYKHTVTLKKITLEKDLSSFSLGDTFLFGSFLN